MNLLKRIIKAIKGFPYKISKVKCPFCFRELFTTDWHGKEVAEGKVCCCHYCLADFKVKRNNGSLLYEYPLQKSSLSEIDRTTFDTNLE